MLSLRGITAGYSASPVLLDVDLDLQAGEIVTLLGANGAGKSTLARVISGLLAPSAGEIRFEDRRIETLSPAERLRLGIVHVPEGRQMFAGMTVAENLNLGTYAARGVVNGRSVADRLDEVCTLFPVLRDRMGDLTGNFSGGQQQMLAIARGLMASPRLIILDEPSLGLSPLLVEEVFQLVVRLRERGLTILLAEQNARSALAIADRAYVVENGRIPLSGPASELRSSPEIAARYLGTRTDPAVARERGARMADELRSSLALR